mmetsp:Transcript_13813/g.27502  ORF Transcript_13813/g.27502 Transcript_13813/m.27502 type:complete len:153 (+) Transcript_13813:253-711(+)
MFKSNNELTGNHQDAADEFVLHTHTILLEEEEKRGRLFETLTEVETFHTMHKAMIEKRARAEMKASREVHEERKKNFLCCWISGGPTSIRLIRSLPSSLVDEALEDRRGVWEEVRARRREQLRLRDCLDDVEREKEELHGVEAGRRRKRTEF